MLGKFIDFLGSLIVPTGTVPANLKLFIELVIYGVVLVFVFFAQPLAYRIGVVRDLLKPQEKYAGAYVQIIDGENGRRYSLLRVSFQENKYILTGEQYDPSGSKAISFESGNVYFNTSPSEYIEFVWKAEDLGSAILFDGYTRMRPNTIGSDFYDGNGFFITFDKIPRRFDLTFIKWTEKTDKKFNLTFPSANESSEVFVKMLHQKLVKAPALEPKSINDRPNL